MYRYFHSWGVRAYAFGPELDPEVADLAGVRWVLVRGSGAPGQPFVERFRSGDDVVYENPDVLPRAFVATAIAPAASRDAIISALATASRDELAGSVFVLATDRATIGPDLPVATQGSTRAVSITRYTPDVVELEVPDGPAGILLLTDAIAPGWTATVDGGSVPMIAADLAFRGIPVTAGGHLVTLRYVPVATILGFWAAGFTVFAAGIALAVVRRADGRAAARHADAG
jgi:hypothetical protein